MNFSLKSSASVNKVQVPILIFVYNSAKFIWGCPEDLMTQSLHQKVKLEINLIDSAPSENEQETVQEFKQKYLHTIYQKTKKRTTIYQAWNRSIRQACSRYISSYNTNNR